MAILSRARALVLSLFFALAVQGAFAEIVSISKVHPLVSIDLPEGYSVTDASKDGSSYQLRSSLLPVSLVIKLYSKDVYKGAGEALEDNLGRLKAKSDMEVFKWRGQESSLAEISFNLGSSSMMGYAAAALLPEDAGTVVLLSWCPESDYEQSVNLILSTMDSLCIDYGSYFSPGLVTSYAYPRTGEGLAVELDILGKKAKDSPF
ncbi:MAG: hypothetical protein IJU95_06585 [Treponema sp.]|nr:hypothetical protein [Treponema sp.]